MNEDKAREICERIIKEGGCYSPGGIGRILGETPCEVCPFAKTVAGCSCGLGGALEGGNLTKCRALAAKMFLAGEIVLVDGKLYEVSDGN